MPNLKKEDMKAKIICLDFEMYLEGWHHVTATCLKPTLHSSLLPDPLSHIDAYKPYPFVEHKFESRLQVCANGKTRDRTSDGVVTSEQSMCRPRKWNRTPIQKQVCVCRNTQEDSSLGFVCFHNSFSCKTPTIFNTTEEKKGFFHHTLLDLSQSYATQQLLQTAKNLTCKKSGILWNKNIMTPSSIFALKW